MQGRRQESEARKWPCCETWVWMGCTREPKLNTHTPKFILEEKNLYYKTYISWWWEKVVKVWRRFDFGWSISFKKTQKQRLLRAKLSAHDCKLLSHSADTSKVDGAKHKTSSKSAQEKSTKFSHFFCQEGKLHRYDTTLLKWIWPKHRKNWVSHELTKEN